MKFEGKESFKKSADEKFLEEGFAADDIINSVELKIYSYESRYGVRPNIINVSPIVYNILKKEMELFLSSRGDWEFYKETVVIETFFGLEVNIVKDLSVPFRVGYME